MNSINKNVEDVIFKKSIRIGDTQSITEDSSETHYGTVRYNSSINRFEGLHRFEGADYLGNPWRVLTTDIATSTTLGTIKVGNNLFINPLTGVLNAVGGSDSLQKAHIIRISPHPGISDFTSITQAIKETILDGSISSFSGEPSLHNQYIIELLPGYFNNVIDATIILPDYVSLKGYSNRTTFLKSNINLGTYSSISHLTLEGIIQSNFKDDILINDVIINNNNNNDDDNVSISIKYGERHIIKNVKIITIELNNSIKTNHIGLYLEQCNINISFLKIYNYNNVINSNSIYLKNCNPIVMNEILTFENIDVNYSIVCDNSMFIMKDSKILSNVMLENNFIYNSETIQNPKSIFKIRNNNQNQIKLELYDTVNSTNLIRLGFLENAKVFCIETKTFHNILKLGINYIIIDNLKDGYKDVYKDVNRNEDEIIFTLIQYNTVILENVIISCPDYTIKSSLSNENYYFINCENLKQLEGGEPDIDNKLIYISFNSFRKILVGNIVGYNYKRISTAFKNIIDATENFRYTIEILEGSSINEDEGLVLKEYIDIISIGNVNVITPFINCNSVKNITIKNIRFSNKLQKLNIQNSNDITYLNCQFISNDGWIINNSYNIEFIECDIKICLTIDTNNEFKRGIEVMNSNLIIKKTKINNYIYSDNGDNGDLNYEECCSMYLNNSKLRIENTDMNLYFPNSNGVYIGGYVIDINNKNLEIKDIIQNEHEIDFLAIQSVFNRNIYIDEKNIKKNIINCSFPIN